MDIDLVIRDAIIVSPDGQTRGDLLVADERVAGTVAPGAGQGMQVETVLPMMLTGVNEGKVRLECAVAARLLLPAQVYGLYPRKGNLNIGTDADFVLVDMQAEKGNTAKVTLADRPLGASSSAAPNP